MRYDPGTDQAAAIAPMSVARVMHTATVLDDGQVLVAGGSSGFAAAHPIGYPASFQPPVSNGTEIYDPLGDCWKPGPPLPGGLTGHRASKLANGRVLIAGGVQVPGAGTPTTQATCHLFDPGSGLLLPAPPLPLPASFQSQIALNGGGASVAGGMQLDFNNVTSSENATLFLYDEVANVWNPGPPPPFVVRCKEVKCLDGPGGTRYKYTGGMKNFDLLTGAMTPETSVTRLDLTTNSWQVVGGLLAGRPGLAVAVTQDQLRLVVVGSSSTGGPGPQDTSAEVYTADF